MGYLRFLWLPALLLPAQEPAPTFRTGTRLVEVSVTVSGRQGVPVKDLTKADFTVLDRGKPREIAFFRFEGGKQQENPKPRTSGLFTNRTDALSGAPRNVVALVLDSLNTEPVDNIRVRAQVLRYLQRLAPATRVALFHMGPNLTVIHDFTEDSESLRNRLAAAAVGMPQEETVDIQQSIAEAQRILDSLSADSRLQSMMAMVLQAQIQMEQAANAFGLRRRIEMTLASMEALGRHLSGIPGRKNIVWISGGVPMSVARAASGMERFGDRRSFEAKIVDTSRRLAQQNVALYIVDARGLQTSPSTDVATVSSVPRPGRVAFDPMAGANAVPSEYRSALSTIASVTGGRFLYDTNDMLMGFKHALADLEGSYTLAFYAPDQPDNKWHELKIKVNRPDVKVQHRQGYVSEPAVPSPPDWTAEEWRAAIGNPVGSSAVKITARCERGPNGQVALAVLVDPSTLHFTEDKDGFRGVLEINISDKTPDGRARMHSETARMQIKPEQMAQYRQRGLPYQRQWAPLEGAATIRIIVRDKATGLYGTLDIPMKELRAAN